MAETPGVIGRRVPVLGVFALASAAPGLVRLMLSMSTSGSRFRVDLYVLAEILSLMAWMAFRDGNV